MDMSRNIS